MAQVDEKLLRQSRENPDQTVAVVVTVDDRFDPAAVKGDGLKEIQAKRFYSGSLSGQAIVELSQQEGGLAIEPDFEVYVP